MDHRDITPLIQEVARNYHYHHPPELLVYMQDIIERFLRLLVDLLNSLHISAPGLADTRMVSNVMQVVLFGAGFIAVAALVFVVWRRLNQLNAQTALAKRGQSLSEGTLDASGWRQQAATLSANGQWKEACRALYFSLLRQLDEQEVLEFIPTRTNYEYYYALARQKQIAATFRQMADIVEECWFGNLSAGQPEYKRCAELLQSAEQEIDQAKAAAQATAEGVG